MFVNLVVGIILIIISHELAVQGSQLFADAIGLTMWFVMFSMMSAGGGIALIIYSIIKINESI